MSTIDKLVQRLRRIPPPKDFAWMELERVLRYYGYTKLEGSGSRVKFISESNRVLSFHKRHPDSTLLKYQIEDLIQGLVEEGKLR